MFHVLLIFNGPCQTAIPIKDSLPDGETIVKIHKGYIRLLRIIEILYKKFSVDYIKYKLGVKVKYI